MFKAIVEHHTALRKGSNLNSKYGYGNFPVKIPLFLALSGGLKSLNTFTLRTTSSFNIFADMVRRHFDWAKN